MGAKPAEAKRLLSSSAAASRIHSRLGWLVRLSKGRTSRMRPRSAVGAGDWAPAEDAENRRAKPRRTNAAARHDAEGRRDEDDIDTTTKLYGFCSLWRGRGRASEFIWRAVKRPIIWGNDTVLASTP